MNQFKKKKKEIRPQIMTFNRIKTAIYKTIHWILIIHNKIEWIDIHITKSLCIQIWNRIWLVNSKLNMMKIIGTYQWESTKREEEETANIISQSWITKFLDQFSFTSMKKKKCTGKMSFKNWLRKIKIWLGPFMDRLRMKWEWVSIQMNKECNQLWKCKPQESLPLFNNLQQKNFQTLKEKIEKFQWSEGALINKIFTMAHLKY